MPYSLQEKNDILTFLVNEINKNLKLEKEKIELQTQISKQINTVKLCELRHKKIAEELHFIERERERERERESKKTKTHSRDRK
jgi:hypothetical protein